VLVSLLEVAAGVAAVDPVMALFSACRRRLLGVAVVWEDSELPNNPFAS
jgi:hypothetical protein